MWVSYFWLITYKRRLTAKMTLCGDTRKLRPLAKLVTERCLFQLQVNRSPSLWRRNRPPAWKTWMLKHAKTKGNEKRLKEFDEYDLNYLSHFDYVMLRDELGCGISLVNSDVVLATWGWHIQLRCYTSSAIWKHPSELGISSRNSASGNMDGSRKFTIDALLHKMLHLWGKLLNYQLLNFLSSNWSTKTVLTATQFRNVFIFDKNLSLEHCSVHLEDGSADVCS